MKPLHQRSWDILSQHFQTASRSLLTLLLILFLLTPPHLQAIHDTNQNGVSDLWEKKYYNGQLASNFTLTADPDGDGWTNAQEAAAGTNPGSGAGLTGLVRPKITHTPAVYLSPEEEGAPPELLTPEVMTITWPTVAGKKYTLLFSTDLAVGSWIAVGSPRIGAGTEIGTSIPLTQPDGSTPAALFWRVTIADEDTDSDTLTDAEEAQLGSSPYSSDGDNDGLSDLAELFTHHSNPISRDSDGDGVSDPDEILVNFTNPLTATDADGDGIPDDFEKYFAKQLLAYQPEATHWGVYHAGLLAGNLDATHDYTGDGMNARELAEALNNIPAAGPADSGYLVEQQGRHNWLQGARYYPPSSSSSSGGNYFHSVPNGYDIYESITPTANLSSQYLLSRIDGVAWSPSPITTGDRMYLVNNLVESAFRRTPTPELSSNGTKFQGRISQTRCRLIATSPGHEAYSKTYIKVVSNSYYFTWDHWEESGVISAEPFTVQLPKGKMLSEWYEFKAPIIDETEGRAACLGLRSVDIAIRKKGESVPANGVLAKTGEVLEFALSPDLFDIDNQLENKIYWLHRELQPDATYGPWTYFGQNGRGTKFEQSMAFGGIYQIKAEFIDGSAEYLYTRKKDEKIGRLEYGPGKKGEPDLIGICDKQIQIDTCREAQTFYASEAYASQFALPAQYGFPGYPNSGNSIIRCNIFVAHRATAAGAVVPKINGFFNEYPPLANEWAGIEDTSIFPGNPTYIQSWPMLPAAKNPQPGWIIAHPSPGDAGHCAIIDYDGEGIGAGISGTINKNYDEFWDGSSRDRKYEP